LSTQAAVWVLVEHIKNPALSFEQLASLLREQRKLPVTSEPIERFFQEHGLKKRPPHRAAIVEHVEHGKEAIAAWEPAVRRGIELPAFADLGALPAADEGRWTGPRVGDGRVDFRGPNGGLGV
jgi:hypothetical protein